MCPSKHELCVLPNMKLELRNKASPLQLAPKPTPKGQHNGAKGPKYASFINKSLKSNDLYQIKKKIFKGESIDQKKEKFQRRKNRRDRRLLTEGVKDFI